MKELAVRRAQTLTGLIFKPLERALEPDGIVEKSVRVSIGTHVTLYHGTWTGNADLIQQYGILPRRAKYGEVVIDRILAGYGLTRAQVPHGIVTYRLQRWRKTAGKVYLSGKREYAIANALAGFEAEQGLRFYIERDVLKQPTTWRDIEVEMPRTVFTVSMPIQAIDDVEEDINCYRRVKDFSDSGKQREYSEKEMIEMCFHQVTTDYVPTSWIVGREDLSYIPRWGNV